MATREPSDTAEVFGARCLHRLPMKLFADTVQMMSVDVSLPNPPSTRPLADSTACLHDPGREVIDRAAAARSGFEHTHCPKYVIGLRSRLRTR
jgi:hypothetical protein